MKYIIYKKTIKRRNGLVSKGLSYFFLKLHKAIVYRKQLIRASYWYLEIDEKGKVIREIGFNSFNDPIAIAPWRGNDGRWPESDVTFNPDEYEHLCESDFVNIWCDVEQKKIMRRRFVGSKARDYVEKKITHKEFFAECYYEDDWAIDEIVDSIEHGRNVPDHLIEELEK